MRSLRPQGLLWICCHAHADVRMIEQIGWQAQQTSHRRFELCRTEMPRGLRNFLNMDRPNHNSIYRLTDRGVEKGAVDVPPFEVE